MYYSISLSNPSKIPSYHSKNSKAKSRKTILYHHKERVPRLLPSEIFPLMKTHQAPHFRKFRMVAKNETTKPSSPPSLSFLSTLASDAAQFIFKAIAPPLDPSVDPKHVFTGNFAPVEEMVPTECPVVEGELPSSLEGAAYIRNGPNPQFLPQRALHSFEGDGMLHSLRFSNGRAIYCSRYVKTYKYTTERDAGGPVILNFFSGFYGLIDVARYFRFIGQSMKGQVERLKGFGGANINVAFFGKKLMALCESDLPYIIDLTQDGDIETLGRWEFDMRMFANMTAHPKVDEVTKETSAYRVNFLSPFLTFFRFDENGVKQNEVNILSMKQPSLIHDFGVTKRFMIFGETQLVLNTAKMIWGRGSLLEYRPTITPRIGILPRYATDDSDLMWLEAPGFNPLHVLNAWENGEDEIVMVATNIKSLENILVKRVFTTLEKLVINMRTGKLISRKSLSPKPLELGSINPSYAGKRNRYVYMAVMDEIPRASGVVKIDVETGREVGSRFFGAGCFGGEALFVRKETENAASEDEDDGYVVTCTHDENSGDSMFVVMDAKSPELDIVAAVQVPRRVPYGFHGLFLTREDLSSL